MSAPHKNYKDYSKFFERHPRSILVVPVANRTTSVDAGSVFLSTITHPLAERGYYVFPVLLTREVLIDLGLTDEGLITSAPTTKFKEIFGADSVLFVTIKDWNTRYIVLSSSVSVDLQYKLVDCASGETLWENEERFVQKSGNSGGGSPIGTLIAAMIDAAVTALVVDYRPLAQQANTAVLTRKQTGLPEGPYGGAFRQDYDQYR